MKKNLKALLVVGLCMVMCIAFVGCGGKEEPAPASTAPPETSSAAPAPEASSAAPAPEASSEEPEEELIEYDLDVLYDNLDEAYGGIMESGEFVGLGMSADGTFGVMIFFTPEEHVTFVGEATINENYITISDEVNQLEITFEVLEGEEGTIIIDLGEEMGGGVIAEITVDDLVDTLGEVVEGTYAIG